MDLPLTTDFAQKAFALESTMYRVACGMLPAPQGIDNEAWDITPVWERLVRSGAFAEVDRFSRSFVTPYAPGTEE